MEIYNLPVEETYYSIKPFSAVLYLLNATWLYYVIPVVTVFAICILLYLAWEVHELPTWKVRKHRLPQTTLITALTIFGMFVHWVWALAFILAFIDWKRIEKAFIRIFFFVKSGTNLDEIYENVDKHYEEAEEPPSFWTTDMNLLLGKEKVEKEKKVKQPSKFMNLLRNVYRLIKESFSKKSKKR